MTTKPKHPPGPPMDLANMRKQGVHHLIAFCLNDASRHQVINLFDKSGFSPTAAAQRFGAFVSKLK